MMAASLAAFIFFSIGIAGAPAADAPKVRATVTVQSPEDAKSIFGCDIAQSFRVLRIEFVNPQRVDAAIDGDSVTIGVYLYPSTDQSARYAPIDISSWLKRHNQPSQPYFANYQLAALHKVEVIPAGSSIQRFMFIPLAPTQVDGASRLVTAIVLSDVLFKESSGTSALNRTAAGSK